MKELENLIEIHQVLHGYKDGHVELASSIKLPPAARRQLATLSDLSGFGKTKGFDEYITGYPIEGAPYYAIAKTWYANEMPRPGCVWTHTLLISTEVQEPGSLLDKLPGLFSRPNNESDYGNYEVRIKHLKSMEHSGSKNVYFTNSKDETFKKIIFADLFNREEKPVILLATDSNVFESLILKIWDSIWPNLKYEFTFCTGAISPRLLNNNLFNLQAVPNNSSEILRWKSKAPSSISKCNT